MGREAGEVESRSARADEVEQIAALCGQRDVEFMGCRGRASVLVPKRVSSVVWPA